MDRPLAVVTGGGRGIGLAITKKLLSKNFQVAAVDINAKALDSAREELSGLAIEFAEVSVLDRDAVKGLAESLAKTHGPLAALVNNAGINKPGSLATQTDDDFDRVIATNLKGAFICSSVFSPYFSNQGAIVNIGSTSASGRDGSPAYAASKAGMIGLTRNMALELGPKGVRANLVAPGITLTDWVTRNIDESRIDHMTADTPLGKAAEPSEIADVVAFLCSTESSHVSGQVISVSGGMWMP